MKYVAACKEACIETTPEERLAFMDKLLNAKSIDVNKEVSVLEIESGVNSVKQLPSPTTSYSATPGAHNPHYIDRDVSLYWKTKKNCEIHIRFHMAGYYKLES